MALRDILVRFGVEVDQKPLEEAQAKTDNLLATFRKGVQVAQAFAAALAVRELWNFVSATVAAADDIGDLAARLGITTDELQVLKAVAEDAGTSLGSIQSAFRNLAKNASDGAAEFGALGVALRDTGGVQKSTTDLFWEAGAAIGSIEDQNRRLAVAQKLFGRSALDLIPIFTAEKGSLDALKEAAVVFSAEFTEQADKLAKKQAILSLRWQAIRALLVTLVLPAFEWLLDVFTKGAALVQKFVQSGRALQTLLTAIGMLFARWLTANLFRNLGSLLGWMFKIRAAGAALLRILLRFALPAVIIDELITTFRGGDTLIRRFIDSMFGLGTTTAVIETVKGAVSDLWETLVLVLDVFFDIRNDGDQTADELEASFLRASENIGKMFDTLIASFGPRIWEGIKKAFMNAGANSVGGLVEKATNDDKKVTAKDVFQATPLGMAASAIAGFGRGFLQGGEGQSPIVANKPSLAAPRMGVTTVERAAPQVTNNITVGNATPAVAREIAAKTGAATANAVRGRDRAAIGAALGI